MTKTVSLSAGANVALDGRFRITRLTLTSAAAAVVSLYDDDDATLTQAEGEYIQRVVTNPATRSRSGIADCAGYSHDYDYVGISTANSTVSADGTEPLPAKLTMALGAAGTQVLEVNLITYQGLVANLSTGSAATLVIEYKAV